jgi:hypothetical protein
MNDDLDTTPEPEAQDEQTPDESETVYGNQPVEPTEQHPSDPDSPVRQADREADGSQPDEG